ncbi:MAG: heme-binding protein [Luminiphilus sp.]|nr:heme-binding protein [Luminiphilus sp.]
MSQLRHVWHIRTLSILLIASMTAAQATAIEEPVYQVEKVWEVEQIEVRAYAPRVMAVTGMNEDSDGGFKVLAGYIFGGNAQEQKIAMTAPVQQSMAGEKEMAFMMPAKYTLEDLPEPEDQRVSFREAPAYTAAVIQFSGWASAEKADEKWQQLRRFLIKEGIEIVGEPTLNQYNPPWTLPFLRRNEIIVPVRHDAAKKESSVTELS